MTQYCPYCYAANPDPLDDGYCTSCGEELDGPSPAFPTDEEIEYGRYGPE